MAWYFSPNYWEFLPNFVEKIQSEAAIIGQTAQITQTRKFYGFTVDGFLFIKR